MSRIKPVNNMQQILQAQIAVTNNMIYLFMQIVEDYVTIDSHHRDRARLVTICEDLKELQLMAERGYIHAAALHDKLVPRKSNSTEIKKLMAGLKSNIQDVLLEQNSSSGNNETENDSDNSTANDLVEIDETAMTLDELKRLKFSSKITK